MMADRLGRRTARPSSDLISDCVHCGFCLPTCPSYAVFEDEMDSPRGRIVLMRVGHEEGAEISPEMVTHFDRCLGCMACVTACPSGVQYDQLIERTRPQIERHGDAHAGTSARTGAAIFELFTHPGRLRALAPLLALAAAARRSTRAGAPAARSPRLRAMLALAPPTSAARAAVRRLPEVVRRRAGRARDASRSCRAASSASFFGDVNAATVRVLAAEGWEVHAPRAAALLRRAADARGRRGRGARRSPRATIAAYEGFDAIVANVAGCGSAMKDYGAPARRRPRVGRAREAFCAKVARRPRAARRARAAAPCATRSRCKRRLPRRLPPRPRPGRPRAAARAAARDPRPRAARARRVGAVLRLGRHLQPVQPEAAAELGARKADEPAPRPAPRRSPPPTRAARCRSPRTSSARSRSTTR